MNSLHQIVSVIAVIKHENEFLLVQRSITDDIFPGKWQNVGGKVEPGETIEHAVLREVEEELGIVLSQDTKMTFLKSYAWIKDKNEAVRLGIIFLIAIAEKPKEIQISSELEQYGWYTLEEAKKLETIGMNSLTGTLAQITAATNI